MRGKGKEEECEFWKGVGRGTGVDELRASAGRT